MAVNNGIFSLSAGGVIVGASTRLFPNGSGAGQVNKMWIAEGSMANGATASINLKSLTYPDGPSMAFTTVLGLVIVNNASEGPLSLTIGGGSTPFITNAILPPLQQGSVFQMVAGLVDTVGFPVTSITNLIQLVCGTESAGMMDYQIAVIGQ